MGLSGGSSKKTTKPIYSAQIEGAANNVNSAYRRQVPKITAISDELGTLVPSLMDTYRSGDENVNAARDYNLDVLSGKYLNDNPYLQDVIDATGADVRNGVTASLGTRGLTGGSAMGDIVSRNLANNAAQLRFADYNAERDRMGDAASKAPGLSAATQIPLASLISILEAQGVPIRTAAGAGSAIGGLLGQYTNEKVKGKPSLMESIGQGLDIGSTIAGFF